MSRALRIEFQGACYHVINRGNGGESAFGTDKDKFSFLRCLERARERFGIRIHTYCLMPDHYHLLVETPHANLSRAMQWVNVAYATRYNRVHQRRGHLFHGRFKAVLMDADPYLKEVSRFIHLDPVRAGMVKTPELYPWSSFRAFIGHAAVPGFLETRSVLGTFGQNIESSRSLYKDFVLSPANGFSFDPHNGSAAGLILGDGAFVKWVKDTFLRRQGDEREVPQFKKLRPRACLQDVLEAVSRETGRPVEALVKKGAKKNVERDLAIYLARTVTGASCEELGALFGGISGAGVTMRVKHFTRLIKDNQLLADKANRIKGRIINI